MIFFVGKQVMPLDRFKDVIFDHIICNYREGKAEPKWSRLIVSGNQINYPEHYGIPMTDILITKLLLISIISTTRV